MKKGCKTGPIYYIVVILSLLAIFGAGIWLGINYANNTSLPTPKIKQEEKYSFNFQDGYVPGASYSGYINTKTGEVEITKTSYCSAIDCPSTTDKYTGTLTKEQLEIVNSILKENNYPSMNNAEDVSKNKTVAELIMKVTYIIKNNDTSTSSLEA